MLSNATAAQRLVVVEVFRRWPQAAQPGCAGYTDVQGAIVDSETAHFIQECHQGVNESEPVRARRVKFQERVHASVPQTIRKETAEEEQWLIVQVAVFYETGATL